MHPSKTRQPQVDLHGPKNSGGLKVVSKRRPYVAAVKPQLLGLELMHFADKVIDTGQFKVTERDVGKKDLQKAEDNMSGEGDPEEYREALDQVIDGRSSIRKKICRRRPAPKPSPKVNDLVAVLHKSLSKAQSCRETRAP